MYTSKTPLEDCKLEYASTVPLLYVVACAVSVVFLIVALIAIHPLDWIYVAPLPVLLAGTLHVVLYRSLRERCMHEEQMRKREAAG